MARALITGMLKANPLQNDHIIVSSPSLCNNPQSSPFTVANDNCEAARLADILFLCTKPHHIPHVCNEIAEVVSKKTTKPLIVSIAAGVGIDSIEKHVRATNLPIIRAMPNTPVSVGLGVIGFYANAFVTDEQITLFKASLEPTGILVQVNQENELDKITAISGSGPAYFLLIEEMLVNAATNLGLSNDLSYALVQQTMLGTSVLTSKSNLSFAALRQQVTSKGGTTAAAIDFFINGGIESLVSDAVLAAYQRAVQLSKSSLTD